MNNPTILDIVTPLRNFKAVTETIPNPTLYVRGYQDGLAAAIELAEVMQIRINLQLGAQPGEYTRAS